MPWLLAPAIGTLIGGVAATAVGKAIIGIGLSVGASALSRKLKPKATGGNAGMRLTLNVALNKPREIAFGTCASAGSHEYHNSYGPNGNDYLQIVRRLADVRCDGLEKVFVNGEQVTLGEYVANATVTGYSVVEYPGAMWIEFHDGEWDQSADADLVSKATGGSWSSDNRGRGVCYARVTLKYDAEIYKDGLPEFLFVFRGARLYDWRKDSTVGGSGSHRWGEEDTYEWTDNAAVITYNYMRGVFVNGDMIGGVGVPATSLPYDHWTAAANASEEAVNLKAGGSEDRYSLNGLVEVDTDHVDVIREMLGTMAGTPVESGGVFKFHPGVSRAPVLAFTDDALVDEEDVTFIPRQSSAALVNAVFGEFHDPEQLYEQSALPARLSPSDEIEDGGERYEESYAFPFVTSGTQGQRLMEIYRRDARHQRRVSLTLKAAFCTLEVGDWVEWTSARYGFEEFLFRVTQTTISPDGPITLELKEVSESIYAWTPATDELDPLDPQPVGSGGERLVTLQGLTVANILAVAGETQRPGLRITWTPVDDPTVLELELEFRRLGDTVALSRKVFQPDAGSYEWIDGVQGGVRYEVRIRPVTMPVRSVEWTAWTQPDANTEPQVVEVAAVAISVPPDTITPEMLSAQARLELSMATARAEIEGSVAAQIAAAYGWAQQAAEVAMEARLAGHANGAAIIEERTARSDGDTALAQMVQQAVTWIEENATTVTEVIESIDGIQGRWGVSIDVNGHVIGLVQLDGSAEASQFTVVANKFAFAHPDISGGEPQPILVVAQVGEEWKAMLNGELIAEAVLAGALSTIELTAIFAHLGSGYVDGVLQSNPGNPKGNLKLDFNNIEFELTTAS